MFFKFIKKYPILIMVLIFMVLCYMKNKEPFTNHYSGIPIISQFNNIKNIPPSSIGPGGLCPINDTYKHKFPICMSGHNCNNETFPYDDEIGICRLNTN